MSSPQFKVINYLPNSYIIVEGKKESENFYIIRSGNVKTKKSNLAISEDTQDLLGPGDFFGVISCMSKHARDEAAIAVNNVSLISVERDQFGMLIQKNPIIAMKIIRFFSRKLRLYNQALARLTSHDTADDNPEDLFFIGEYYFKKKALRYAAYAYQKYIEYCPKGFNVENAINSLKQMNSPLKAPVYQQSDFKRSYPDGSMIICENEPGMEAFVIQGGKIKITKISGNEEIFLAILDPGAIFGEQALLDNKPRNASAFAIGDVSLMVINKANFEEMVHMKPQLAIKIISLLSERIWSIYRQLENSNLTDPLSRIYDVLLLEVEKQRIPITSHASHNFEFGTNILLQMARIPAEKGAGIINKFLEDKNFSLEGGKIICRNLEQLETEVTYKKRKEQRERKREESKAV